jgi:methionyl-tRNA formyltransferase
MHVILLFFLAVLLLGIWSLWCIIAPMARLAFFGSPAFAVPCLRAVATAHEVVLVVCAPDGGTPRHPCEVKKAALALGLPVHESRLAAADVGSLVMRLCELETDLGVTVAFGPDVPQALLDAPKRGVVTVHASLLPRWRGEAPIERAIAACDAETGVSLFARTHDRYAGPIYAQRSVALSPEDDYGSLERRLAEIGAELLVAELPAILEGRATPAPQDEASSTVATKIGDDDFVLDLGLSARQIVARQRALAGRGGLETSIDGRPVVLFGANRLDIDHGAAVGTRLVHADCLAFATHDGVVSFAEVREAGSGRLSARESRSLHNHDGDRDRRARLVSAALRHVRVAAHLILDTPHRSLDDAFYLAGFGPECARSACLAEEWFARAVGHGFDDPQNTNLNFVMGLDPRARRYRTSAWADEFPVLTSWRVQRRYDRTGTVEREAAARLIAAARTIVDRIAVQLWTDGMLVRGAFA